MTLVLAWARPARDAVRHLGGLALFIVLMLAPALAGASDAFADEARPIGPADGADVSAIIAGIDQTGEARAFDDLTGDAGLVVFFNRSLDWCPFCRVQAVEIEAAFDDFHARGYGVVIVTIDSQTILARYARRHDTRTTLLSDPEAVLVRALDLLDPAFPEGHRHHGLPYPATLILDADGALQDLLFRESVYGEAKAYRQRIATSDVLASLDGRAPDEAGSSVH